MVALRSARKRGLGIDVLTAARERIAWTFDRFPKVYVSFSGGKDSTVTLHLVMKEAIRRGRKVGVLFIDLEAQYKLTIDHVLTCYRRYWDHIEPYWIALPLNLRNAVSIYQPQWTCWDPERPEAWVRRPPDFAITDERFFPFFRRRMEFEEFTPAFGYWYSGGKPTACIVAIRSDESLNRWRTIGAGRKQTLEGKPWTTWIGEAVFNVYPIYDWRTEDLWTFHARYPELPYNQLYDRMHQAGLSIHQMRICQPYGDDQRKGLWLFHVIEPETWSRVVARVEGANSGALYAREAGSINGVRYVTKPDGLTWQQYAEVLLESMPRSRAEHYRNKIAVFIQWYREKKGYWDGIPDEGPLQKGHPSWKRICRVLLRHDYWCKDLSFSPTKTEAYQRYLKIMEQRRRRWGLFTSDA